MSQPAWYEYTSYHVGGTYRWVSDVVAMATPNYPSRTSAQPVWYIYISEKRPAKKKEATNTLCATYTTGALNVLLINTKHAKWMFRLFALSLAILIKKKICTNEKFQIFYFAYANTLRIGQRGKIKRQIAIEMTKRNA